MKRVVSTGLHEGDIRPFEILSEFRRLSIEESRRFFSDPTRLVDVACPGCGATDGELAWRRQDFSFLLCSDCQSVWVSPRPDAESLSRYFRKSAAAQYRVEQLARRTARARELHFLSGVADWTANLLGSSSERGRHADLATSLPSFLSLLDELEVFSSLHSVAPHSGLIEEIQATTATVETELPAPVGSVSALEQLEHWFSPLDELRQIHTSLEADGVILLTTRTISGFDLQVLWDQAPWIIVPEHLNLLSLQGAEALLERSGFDVLELSTPGQLDVEGVRNALSDPALPPLPRFLDRLVRSDAATRDDFQTFLQKNRLSSHLRIAGQKRTPSP